MARSDPPFDAADETTTQPVGRQRAAAEPAKALPENGRQEPPAESLALPNTNWFNPDFDSEETRTQPSAPMAPDSLESPRESVAEPDAPREADTVTKPALAQAAKMAHDQTISTEVVVAQSAERSAMTPPEPPTAEPRMESVTAAIAAALAARELINREPAPRGDFAPAHTSPSFVKSEASFPAAQPASKAPAPTRRSQSRTGGLVDRAGRVLGIVVGAWVCVVLMLIVLYRFINPPFSTLIAAQWLSGGAVRQEWVRLESISPNLIHAVIVSEDGRFCDHWGIDFVEIAEALKRTPRGVPRGASTITMQVAKNLFLWPAKSYLRKIIEVPLTYAIELFWPKRRILEVYLNIAEWGPGIFGAEAASQAHFNHPASRLSQREAAQLAVVLPNPIVRDAGSPGPRTAHRASVIQRRTGREPEAIACIFGAE
jgi:monofunctional biosynthetic peptidoglycan transglycosylase